MKTFQRICIVDYEVDGFLLKRGKEYLTSAEGEAPAIICPEHAERGYVTVFTTYWIKAPVSIFAGEIRFT